MDPFLARTMVETLSKGINPVTGRTLDKRDSCANEEIQDALIEVLEHCTIESVEQYMIRLKEEKEAEREERKIRNAKRYPMISHWFSGFYSTVPLPPRKGTSALNHRK